MKKIILMSTAFALLTFLMLGTNSCKKVEEQEQIQVQPADKIAGDYIGSGTDSNGASFIMKVIRVSKVSSKRVKVQPIGHSKITSFEVNVESFGEAVATLDDTEGSLSAEIQNETAVSIGFETIQQEAFGGTKQ